MTTPLQDAKKLAAAGLNVLPAPVGGKAPSLDWRKFQNIRTDDRLGNWFSGAPRNFWIVCGRISRVVVLDCDSEVAIDYWRRKLEPSAGEDHPLDVTTAVQTRKGMHFYFAIDDDEHVASWSYHKEGTDFDVRAEGTGVIAPPSVHETGHVYSWIRPMDAILPLPQEVRVAPKDLAVSGGAEGGGVRSMLTQLLKEGATTGDRNNWFSKVCGHYAKEYRDRRDAYDYHVWAAYDGMGEPHPKKEAEKTVESVWNKEQRKFEGTNPNEDNGHLVPGDHTLLTPCRIKDGADGPTLEVLRQWANFDIVALGVVESSAEDRVYDVVVKRKRQRDEISDLLPSKVLADSRALAAWLANHGVVITTPSEPQASKVRETSRLQLYMEDQDPPHFEAVPALGWYGDEFICHEGVIDATGMHGHSGKKPAVHLRTRAKHAYGFIDDSVARSVLREVLTFHDETVAAVFGSWWAASLVKPQIKRQFSQFPIMAIEAPSESGKTTGMFPMLLELGGSTEGQSLSTKAAMTRNLADHNSGIVWIDDANDLNHIDELLRAVTGDGFIKKMGEDRTNTVVEELVAPVMLSGEALGRSDQKATADRRITLEVSSPVGRKSLLNPDRPQWDDIQRMRAEYPDGLSAMAGNMIQCAAQASDEIDRAARAATGGTRNQHKLTILLIGARILARMTGEDKWIKIVGDWVKVAADSPGSYNTMVERMIPESLMLEGNPTWPRPGGQGHPPTPCFISDGTVYYNTAALASWWEIFKHGRVEERTETLRALELQRKVLGGETRRFRFNRNDSNSKKAFYWSLPEDASRYVINLVESSDDDQAGVGQDQVSKLGQGHLAVEVGSGAPGKLPGWLIDYMTDLEDPGPPKTRS